MSAPRPDPWIAKNEGLLRYADERRAGLRALILDVRAADPVEVRRKTRRLKDPKLRELMRDLTWMVR